MIGNNSKRIKIIFYLTIILLNFSCVNPKDNSSLNDRERDEWYKWMINEPIYSMNFELLPACSDDFILRFHKYEYRGPLEYVLTIRKKDGEYFLQLIHKQERDLEEKYREDPYNSIYFKVVEKKLNNKQKDFFQKGMKDMIALKTGDLDSNFHINNVFDMFIKEGESIKAIRGMSSAHSYNRYEDKWYLNEKKDKILRFIGRLLHYGDMKNNEKKVIFHIEGDTVKYTFYVQKFQDWREISYYFDNKKVKYIGMHEIKLHKKDTANIFNRVKIKETLWDGTIREY